MSSQAKVVSTIDLSEFADGLAKGAEKALRTAVEYLLTEANKTVPHDEGTLERSGQATVDGTKGAVSYDTPYAVRQHEDLAFHHDGKGKAKWLENTLALERNKVGQIVATIIQHEAGT